jgi:hypothetical protein
MSRCAKRSLSGVACAALCAGLVWAPGPAPVAARQEGTKVEVGKPAPPIDLPATQIDKVLPGKKDARTLSLKDLRGKNVVVYFFPKALTRG